MSENQDTAAYLEELAATLASHGSNLAALRMAELEQKVSPYLAAPGVPTRQVGSDVVANTLGNTQPYIGQSNQVNDPTMESVYGWNSATTATVSYQYLAASDPLGWYLAKISTVAGGAELKIATAYFDRGLDGNSFNTLSYDLKFTPGTSQTATAYWRTDPVNLQLLPALPYVVGALRLANLSNVADWANYSVATAYLEIVTGVVGSESVVATSPAYDLKVLFPVLNSVPPVQFQAVVSCPVATLGGSTTTGIRLRIALTSTGAVTAVQVYLGEPQLHFAYSPDPLPFSPTLARYRLSGPFYKNGIQVVGTRLTGWGAPTGTATRTTFATTTVTLPELAERLHALIDDLTTHGLVGP